MNKELILEYIDFALHVSSNENFDSIYNNIDSSILFYINKNGTIKDGVLTVPFIKTTKEDRMWKLRNKTVEFDAIFDTHVLLEISVNIKELK
jgi:hypothetical protein